MSKDKLLSALDNVYEFIQSLDVKEEQSEIFEYDVFFSIADEGALILSGDKAVHYRNCLNQLVNSIGNELFSNKSIEAYFQRTILTALDIQKKRQQIPFEQRIKAAIEDLKKSLLATPIDFDVFYPVKGLALDGLPLQVGNVQFYKFDDEHFERLINFLVEYEIHENETKGKKELLDLIKQSDIIGQPVGLIRVQAIDKVAAKALALKELIMTINLINFFSDLIPYQKGYIFLPGNNERITINVPIISRGEKPSFSFGWEVVGPLTALSFQQLLDTDKKQNFGFSRASHLLTKNRNDLEERLFSAIMWAGKATVDRRREESFLLYAISLETLVLLENENGELTYRLSTRVAHLIGKDLASRKNISDNVRYLYGIRSRIVHSGSYQVTDADLSLIGLYTKLCILTILNHEPFVSMTKNDLVNWFNDRIFT